MKDDKNLRRYDSERPQPFRDCVEDAVKEYLTQMEGQRVRGLYQFVLAEMERPLLQTVIQHFLGNQSQASRMLGISRSTLRKKLESYKQDED